MIPTILLGKAQIPNDGGELNLTQHDGEFIIGLTGVHGDLMASRMHCSEDALLLNWCPKLLSGIKAR